MTSGCDQKHWESKLCVRFEQRSRCCAVQDMQFQMTRLYMLQHHVVSRQPCGPMVCIQNLYWSQIFEGIAVSSCS